MAANTAETFGVKTVDRSGNATQETYHEAKDLALEGAHRAKEAVVEGHDALRRFIEDRPHTATFTFLVLGCLLGFWAGSRQRYW